MLYNVKNTYLGGKEMKVKKVSIKYLFFQAFKTGTEECFDLVQWIDKCQNDLLQERNINGIRGRLEEYMMLSKTRYIALNFMRLEEISDTYIVQKNKRARHIDLDDGEYLGKKTIVL